jgi:hypothetical protein
VLHLGNGLTYAHDGEDCFVFFLLCCTSQEKVKRSMVASKQRICVLKLNRKAFNYVMVNGHLLSRYWVFSFIPLTAPVFAQHSIQAVKPILHCYVHIQDHEQADKKWT